MNAKNTVHGINARRGDGTFGELIPHTAAIQVQGFNIRRGRIATVEIGTEVKILAKAMIKQIDRVIGDLEKQVVHFRAAGGNPISVAIVGVNHSDCYTSYERDRAWITDGRTYKHPSQEAAEAERRLIMRAKPRFDEFVLLPYRASNEEPFPFEWVNENQTMLDYGAALTRILRTYETRF